MLKRHCTRILEFDAAHRVLRHESKCATLHGHRYKVEVTCEASSLDSVGRVVDFGVIKQKFGQWVDDNLDHTTIVNEADSDLIEWTSRDHARNGKRAPYLFPGEPTAENLAKHLLEKADQIMQAEGAGLRVRHVRVWETPNCYADFEAMR